MSYYNFVSDVRVDDTLNVGSNVLISDLSADFKVFVDGNLYATALSGDGSNIQNLTLAGDGSAITGLTPDQITATNNSHSNTIQFANAGLSFFTDGPAGVGAAPGAGEDFVVGSVLTVDADAADVLTVDGNVSATNVNANFLYGDGSGLTNVTDASAGTYGDSNTVASVTVSADGRISSVSDVNINFQDVTRTGGTTDAALQSASLSTTGAVGVSNTNSLTYDLSVGDALLVDIDAATDGNVLVVNGNVSATYFYGDGSKLDGVTSVDTLADVVDRGNTTSNTVQFTNSGISLVASGNVDAVNLFASGLIAGDGGLVSNVVHSVTAGAKTYGSASKVPTLAINASGQITQVSETDVQSNVAAAGANQVAVYSDSTTLGGSASLTFANGTLDVDGDLNVSGNLFVTGNTHVSNNVVFEDSIIEIGNNAATNIDRAVLFTAAGNTASNVAMAYHGDGTYVDKFTVSFTDGSAYDSTIVPTGEIDMVVVGQVTVEKDLIVGSSAQFIVDEANSRVGIANAAPGHSLSVGTEIYADAASGDLTARLYNGDGGALSNLSALTSASDVTASSNATVGLAFGDNGRILSIGTQDISLDAVALTDNEISSTALNLSNALALYTSGSVGINNANPAHDLVVGASAQFYVDADSSNIVANVIGNVNASYYFGDGSNLEGVASVDTLSDVVNRGNTTSNVMLFENATTALSVTQTDAVIHFSSNVRLSASGDSTFIDSVRVADVASNVMAITSTGEVVQSGIAIDAAKAVSIHDQKLFVSSTKTCTAGGSTNVAKLTFPGSKTSLVKIDAFTNDNTNASAHHAEYLVASVSGGAITTTQIVGFGSNNIVGSAGTPVTGVTVSDGTGKLDINVTLAAGTNQTVSFTIEASSIDGITLDSLPLILNPCNKLVEL